MRRPQLRIRTILILIMLCGIALGLEAWRRRPVPGRLDDALDAYLERYSGTDTAKVPGSK